MVNFFTNTKYDDIIVICYIPSKLRVFYQNLFPWSSVKFLVRPESTNKARGFAGVKTGALLMPI